MGDYGVSPFLNGIEEGKLCPPHRAELLKDWTVKGAARLHLFSLDKPYNIQSPNHALERINAKRLEEAEKAGVEAVPFPEVRVDDLRHTYGSVALSKGIFPALVSEPMGHANPTITLNIYQHVRWGYVFDTEGMVQPQTRPVARA